MYSEKIYYWNEQESIMCMLNHVLMRLDTTTKPRFREGGNTLTKYSFTLTKMIRDGQPSHNSSHGNEITKIQFS